MAHYKNYRDGIGESDCDTKKEKQEEINGNKFIFGLNGCGK